MIAYIDKYIHNYTWKHHEVETLYAQWIV